MTQVINTNLCHLPEDFVEPLEDYCNRAFSGLNFNIVQVQTSQRSEREDNRAFVTTQNRDLLVQYNYSDGDCFYDVLEALVHEAVHAKQMSQGRLSYVLIKTDFGVEWGFKWEGHIYRVPKSTQEVIKLPWEVEAYRVMGEVMCKNFPQIQDGILGRSAIRPMKIKHLEA